MERQMKFVLLASCLLSLIVMCALIAYGQQQDDALPFTETQQLKLGKLNAEMIVSDREMVIAQQAFTIAQTTYLARRSALEAEMQRIKNENKWGDDVECKLDTLRCVRHPAKTPRAEKLP
jgi:hypothetical protein